MVVGFGVGISLLLFLILFGGLALVVLHFVKAHFFRDEPATPTWIWVGVLSFCIGGGVGTFVFLRALRPLLRFYVKIGSFVGGKSKPGKPD